MRVLLLSPNTVTEPYPVYPLGLDYVAGSIGREHTVEIADLNVVSLPELEQKILRFSPDVIGVSCRNIDNTDISDPKYFLDDHASLISWLRHRSKAVIVCGGSGFTIMPKQIMETLGADYGIIGEGERFGLLVEALQNNQPPEEIEGVISADGQATTASPQPWQGARKRTFNSEAEHLRFYLDRGGMLNLQSKRGCRFKCVYCPYPAIEGRSHRLVDPDLVARTALQLQNAGARYFFITDSAFNSDIGHSLEVARKFKATGVTIPWGAFFAPVKIPADYFKVMADAGLTHVEFGTESLSANVLKNYQKPFGIDEVFVAHSLALDAGLHTAHYLLMGGPGESAATVLETLDNIDKLKKTVLFFFFGIRIYPQTPLHTIALREGKITPDTDLLKPVFYTADDIELKTIETLVNERVGHRINCIVGSGGNEGADKVEKLHKRGYAGPLWEYLIR